MKKLYLLPFFGIFALSACTTAPVEPEAPAGAAAVSPTASAASQAGAGEQAAKAPESVAPATTQALAPTTSAEQSSAAPRAATPSVGLESSQQASLDRFIDDMVSKHDFDRAQLENVFQGFEVDQDIIKKMTRPAEGVMPWYRYRKIFITPARLAAGNKFGDENREILGYVADRYQVPVKLIQAILGIETFYGRNMGNYPVLNANASLFLGFPRRAAFFRQQLADFLLLSRQNDLDVRNTKGSYAGAMGMPQFISSSYRSYAVDGDGDGKSDLWNSVPDIAASVANYFNKHGWHLDEPVAIPAAVLSEEQAQPFLSKDMRPRFTMQQLADAGITPGVDLGGGFEAQLPVSLLKLEGEQGPEYYITFHNFYVITRYNRSPLYAMAAVEMMKNLR